MFPLKNLARKRLKFEFYELSRHPAKGTSEPIISTCSETIGLVNNNMGTARSKFSWVDGIVWYAYGLMALIWWYVGAHFINMD